MRVAGSDYTRTFSQGFRQTTNNRMELMAVIVALENMKAEGHDLHIYTDSRYVSEAINQKWLYGWVKKNFKKVKNPDLWKRFYPLYLKYKPQLHWVKGHAGHRENEIVDQLAVKAAQSPNLLIDHHFENPVEETGLF